MSEIDPLVAEILLKGDDEFLSRIKKVGDETAERFEHLTKAVEGGATSFKTAALAIGLIEAALAGVVAATISFIEVQTELSQKTKLLADAFGTTGEQLQNIEQVFAASGVKVEQFERFAVRLSTTIAREWPHISESMKSFANESDASNLRVSNSILRVQEAQKNLLDHSEERASQMARDNNSVEQSYIKLQFAAQHAAQEQIGALQSLRGAQLSVTAAEQHLAELQGRPPSAAEKQNLAIAQAQQSVDTARRAEAEARIAMQEKAATAALKARQVEQEYDDIARKAAKNARDDAEQRQKDENAVKEAIIARGEAEQRAAKFALTNVGSIKGALDGIVAGNKSAATAINLTEVSVENLKRAVIAQAAETSKATTPTGWEALRTIAKLLKNDVEGLITPQQRLRLVTELAGSSMQALGASAAEILNVIEHNSQAFDDLANHAEKAGGELDKDAHKIEEFRGALAKFNLTVSQLSQSFAAAISPAFTAFLNRLNDSLKSNDGLIHNFISGLVALGQAIGALGSAIVSVADTFAKFINLLSGRTLNLDGWALIKGALVTIGILLVALTGPIGIIIAGVTALVVAIGYVRDHWEQVTKFIQDHKAAIIGIGVAIAVIVAAFAPWTVALGLIGAGIVLIVQHWGEVKAAIASAWEQLKDNAVTRFLERAIDLATKLKNLMSGNGWKGKDDASLPNLQSDGSNTPNVEGHAEGGPIRGPGTGTSDSILARLSNGEFVTKAKAVAFWGSDFMHAINNMQLPGFASGGLVPAPVRMSGGGTIPATSTVNLSIDGRSFNGLKGPKSTVDDLANFAISRQTSAAGSNPSWMK
jgi:predicted NUDIX family NTP pyrophosphohydrolase